MLQRGRYPSLFFNVTHSRCPPAPSTHPPSCRDTTSRPVVTGVSDHLCRQPPLTPAKVTQHRARLSSPGTTTTRSTPSRRRASTTTPPTSTHPRRALPCTLRTCPSGATPPTARCISRHGTRLGAHGPIDTAALTRARRGALQADFMRSMVPELVTLAAHYKLLVYSGRSRPRPRPRPRAPGMLYALCARAPHESRVPNDNFPSSAPGGAESKGMSGAGRS